MRTQKNRWRYDDGTLTLEGELHEADWINGLKAIEAHWVENTPENQAAWQAQYQALWVCIYQGCFQFNGTYTDDERSMACDLILRDDLDAYDPNKVTVKPTSQIQSRLATYMLGRIKLRLRDAYASGRDIEYMTTYRLEESDMWQKRETDAVDNATFKAWVQEGLELPTKSQLRRERVKGRLATRLEQPIKSGADSDDSGATLGDMLPDPTAHCGYNNIQIRSAAEAGLYSLLAQVLHFDTYQKGQRNSEARRLHYSLCYTEQVCCFAMEGGFVGIERYASRNFRQADIIKALRKSYVNYFCQDGLPEADVTVDDLFQMHLKRRCDCFSDEEGNTERLKWKKSGFLDAKVPISYLRDVEAVQAGNSDVSRYRSKYLEDTKNLLGEKGYDHTILSETE